MSLNQIEEVKDRLQWIVDLMGNNARHSPHSRKSLRIAQRLLGLQSRGYIPANLQHHTRFISIALQNLSTGHHDLASIFRILNQIAFPTLPLRDGGFYLSIGHGKWRIQQVMKVFTASVFRSPTVEGSRSRIPELNGPVQVAHHDC